jgi:hypothetical protein
LILINLKIGGNMDIIMSLVKELGDEEKGIKIDRNGSSLFSLDRIKALPRIIIEKGIIADLAITPYYSFGSKIMELYEYTLSIRIVGKLREKSHYFLEETGCERIEDIPPEVLKRLDMTYYEVINGSMPEYIVALERYINFMEHEEDPVIKRTKVEIKESHEDGIILYELF